MTSLESNKVDKMAMIPGVRCSMRQVMCQVSASRPDSMTDGEATMTIDERGFKTSGRGQEAA